MEQENLIENPTVFAKAFHFVKQNRIFVRLISFTMALVTAVAVTVFSQGLTLGFDVNYNGKVIATIKDYSVFESAKAAALKCLNGKSGKGVIEVPKLTLTLTTAGRLSNTASVASSLIENTDGIIKASALKVNGKIVACVESDELSALLEARRTAFFVDGAQNEASFVKNVEIVNGYYLSSEIDNQKDIEAIINGLEVKTVSTLTSDVSIPFATQKLRTDTQTVGYSKVTTAGRNGVNRKTEVIENISGTETKRVVTAETVVTAPVTQIVTIGTAPARVSATERANYASAGFICPITKGRYTISARWGDGRNHKAIDLAADKGVPIFAAAGGTVTYAGYDRDYGYNVVIDHGNGMKTRYAHANALCVSVGTKVSQGDMIATVGSTGQSTGNHLHFEVIVNGSRVNPAPYIGL